MKTDYTVNGCEATSEDFFAAMFEAFEANGGSLFPAGTVVTEKSQLQQDFTDAMNKKSCDCGRPYLGHYIGTVVLGKDIGVTVMP